MISVPPYTWLGSRRGLCHTWLRYAGILFLNNCELLANGENAKKTLPFCEEGKQAPWQPGLEQFWKPQLHSFARLMGDTRRPAMPECALPKAHTSFPQVLVSVIFKSQALHSGAFGRPHSGWSHRQEWRLAILSAQNYACLMHSFFSCDLLS